MKRSMPNNSNNNFGPPKKSFKDSYENSDKKVVRFLVPNRAAGLIIGKGGENIKRIKQEHPAKMHIPDASGGERVFVIETDDIKTVCTIARDILGKIKNVCNGDSTDNRGKRERDQNIGSSDEESLVDLRLLVHQSQAGSVIGKGGERIKELRKDHKMKVIKVYQVCAPRSTDRVIQMIGTIDNVCTCLEAMLESIFASPPRGDRYEYDANCWDESSIYEYGGWFSNDNQRMYQQPTQMHNTGSMVAMGPPMMQGMFRGPGPQIMDQGQLNQMPVSHMGRGGGSTSRGGRVGGRGNNYGSRGSHKQQVQAGRNQPQHQRPQGNQWSQMTPGNAPYGGANAGMMNQQFEGMPSASNAYFQQQSSLMGNALQF